jgi:hypothetical protein
MKKAFSGMLRRVALVRSDVSEELGVSIIRMTRIGELGKTFLQVPHGVTSQETAFFIDRLGFIERNTQKKSGV